MVVLIDFFSLLCYNSGKEEAQGFLRKIGICAEPALAIPSGRILRSSPFFRLYTPLFAASERQLLPMERGDNQSPSYRDPRPV